MRARVAEIWRHPVKGIGRERLAQASLAAGAPLPGDRAWAVLHAGAAADTDAWQPRRNFLQAASGPALMAVHVTTEAAGLRFTHPARADVVLRLPDDAAALLDWVRPLWPADRPVPRRLVAAPPQSLADNGRASLALLNRASLEALAARIGRPLDMRRFRGNLVLDGLAAWEEWAWIGREISLGGATLKVEERIGRCRATEANPETGERDADTLAALRDGWGHTDFGVYATVTRGGPVAEGDAVSP